MLLREINDMKINIYSGEYYLFPQKHIVKE